MNLPVPVVGIDPGPDYALNINACLAAIDAHTHSNGSGVLITPNGLNISSDLPILNNNITLLRSLRLNPQLSALNGALDLGCLYEVGVDLYYNDGSGNQIQITKSGNVTGATGTITGLPSGTASASYSAGTFTFQSATSTAATLDIQSLILRNSGASSNGLTLSAPSLASNYSLILPQLPSQTNVMTLDTSGNMGSITYDAVGAGMTSIGADAIGSAMDATGANAIAATRTRASGSSTEGIGGVALSGTSGTFASTSTSLTNITGLQATLTTSGRPVYIGLIPDPSTTGTTAFLGSSAVADSETESQYYILRDGVIIGCGFDLLTQDNVSSSNPIEINVPPGVINTVDFVAAGTYTYTLQGVLIRGTEFFVHFCNLVVYEL